jgi:hypothetical protein
VDHFAHVTSTYSGQKWNEFGHSHASDIAAHYPVGSTSTGLDAHIEKIKPQFNFAPDSRVEAHPIRLEDGNFTAVEGTDEAARCSQFVGRLGRAMREPRAARSAHLARGEGLHHRSDRDGPGINVGICDPATHCSLAGKNMDPHDDIVIGRLEGDRSNNLEILGLGNAAWTRAQSNLNIFHDMSRCLYIFDHPDCRRCGHIG